MTVSCVMPLVIGVTATPQRFDNLIAGTTSTVQKVIVPPEQVRGVRSSERQDHHSLSRYSTQCRNDHV